MGYIVYRPGGTNDFEFEDYVRSLRKRGIDIGKVPRVLEPETGSKWLYVWNTAQEAQSFANELGKGTRENRWQVTETQGQPSEGPMGPLLILLTRRADGFDFALHGLSRAMLASAFPKAVPSLSAALIDRSAWHDFRQARGGFAELGMELTPNLTGLTPSQVEQLGFRIVDADSGDTVAAHDPAA